MANFIGPEKGEMACGEYGEGKCRVQDKYTFIEKFLIKILSKEKI